MIAPFYIRALLFVQPLFWMILFKINYENLDKIFHKLEMPFYIIGIGFNMVVATFSIDFEFYTPELIITYSIFAMIATLSFSYFLNFRQALCMGFLIAYLNSFYWEFMIHIVAFISIGFNQNTIIQGWRLISLPFIFTTWEFNDKRKAFKLLLKGFLISAIFVFARGLIGIINIQTGLVHRDFYRAIHYYMNYPHRLISLLILIKIFFNFGRIRRKEDVKN